MEVGIVATRLTRTLETRNTRCSAQQCSRNVGHWRRQDIAAVDRRNGSGHIHFLLCGKCRHYDLIHQLLVGGKCNGQHMLPRRNRLLKALVANITKLQHYGRFRDFYFKTSI